MIVTVVPPASGPDAGLIPVTAGAAWLTVAVPWTTANPRHKPTMNTVVENVPGSEYVCVASTMNPPLGSCSIVARDLVPSPHFTKARKSWASANGSRTVKVATGPLNGAPAKASNGLAAAQIPE